MTYSQFLLVFIVPPLLFLIVSYLRTEDPLKPYFNRGILLLALMALIYTTPWDNYLVKSGVWTYEDARVLGRIGYVPIEEYCFFILQSCLTGLWCFFTQGSIAIRSLENKGECGFGYLMGIIFWLVTFGVGVFAWGSESTRYLSLILVWATPVALMQWAIGGRALIRNWRLYLTSLVPPTLYLWAVDAYAIGNGVWSISTTQTIGWEIGNLPIEEAAFFLMTNVMLCQGLILFVALRSEFLQICARLKLKAVL